MLNKDKDRCPDKAVKRAGADARCALRKLPSHFGHENLLAHLDSIASVEDSNLYRQLAIDFVSEMREALGR